MKKRTPVASASPSWLAKKITHVKIWLHYQAEAFQLSFSRLCKTPGATLLTSAVIGIALLLPCVLFLLLANLKDAASGLNESTQMTLYLKTGTTDDVAKQLVSRIHSMAGIDSVVYISPTQGLNEFAHQAGFTDLIDELPNNPLPGVIVVKPVLTLNQPERLTALSQSLQKIPEVDSVRYDMLWVKRLKAFILLGQRGAIVFAVFIAIGVILIVGNTLRLMVQKRLNEIEIMKLIGATHQFVRRPFLYAGFLYGLTGAILAYLFLLSLMFSLKEPVALLLALYPASFAVLGLSTLQVLSLLVVGAVLGLLSAFLSVSRQIYAVQPRE